MSGASSPPSRRDSSSHERWRCHFFPVSSYEGFLLGSADLPRASPLNITHWRLEFQREFGVGVGVDNKYSVHNWSVFFSAHTQKLHIQSDFFYFKCWLKCVNLFVFILFFPYFLILKILVIWCAHNYLFDLSYNIHRQ